MKYRKKPVVIEAVEWKGDNLKNVYEFMGQEVDFKGDWRIQDRFHELQRDKCLNGLSIDTLEGAMKADLGDYIIKGIKGEIYPCKPDIFKQTYEKVDE
jgi:hypothetical protein